MEQHPGTPTAADGAAVSSTPHADPAASSDSTNSAAAEPDDPSDRFDPLDFGPVPVRYRHDGWVPDRQLAFIEALADSGCVDTACRAVGMSRNSAYALRRRPDAQAFRLAWDAALDSAVAQLADSALARAIHGVAVPLFHGGELIGERRHFDERLTMFLLRYRDPTRYGKWRDRMEQHQAQDGPFTILSYRVGRMLRAGWRAFYAALDDKPVPEPERELLIPPPGEHAGPPTAHDTDADPEPDPPVDPAAGAAVDPEAPAR